MKNYDRQFRVLKNTSTGSQSATERGVLNNPTVANFRNWEGLDVTRNSRYLSDFDANHILMDARHPKATQISLMEIDLYGIRLQCDGGESIYKAPQPITNFPHLCDALKIALNYACFRNANGRVQDNLIQTRTNAMRIFAWMMRAGKYHLKDLTREDIDKLALEVGSNGWEKTLGLEERLKSVIELARLEPYFAKSLINNNGGSYIKINSGLLEQYIGGPINATYISREIRNELAKIAGDKRAASEPKGQHKPTDSLLNNLFRTLNLLSLSPVDSIGFHAVPNIQQKIRDCRRVREAQKNKTCEHDTKKADKSIDPAFINNKNPTQNISIDDSARLLTEALKWRDKYSKGIIIVLKYARELLTATKPLHPPLVTSKVLQKWEDVEKKCSLPQKRISGLQLGPDSLFHQIELLFFAIYMTIGISSGKRPSEIHGHGVPYGLYYGSLKKIVADFPAWDIEMYVEKSIQDYALFPANALMFEAISTLEEIYRVMVQKDGSIPDENSPTEIARKQKLFTFRRLSFHGIRERKFISYQPRRDLKEFFMLAGVDPTPLSETMTPFRRLFATLFIRRYDLPEYPALRDYLSHFDLATSQGYHSDRNKPLKRGKAIRDLHPLDDMVSQDMIAEIRSASTEYMASLASRLIKGEEIGGIFPLMIAKLYKRLSACINFRELSIELQSKNVANSLSNRGYLPTPMKHVVCVAESPRHTKKMAKCFRDDRLHREDSNPSLCTGCINSIRSSGYILNLEEVKNNSQIEALKDYLPKAIREAHVQRASMIDDVLQAEIKIIKKNRQHFDRLIAAWPSIAG